MNDQILDAIAQVGILPVIKIEKLEYALPLARALRDGGINAIEITARSSAAFEAISAIREKYPDMIAGAGTIHNASLTQQALEAGAQFIVTPGYSAQTVAYCVERDVPVVPGCSTASDMELAMAAGLKTVKFFPAEINGGAAALKLYRGPFPNLKFVPTGGITYDNLSEYLKLDCVAACGGSFMAGADIIRNEDWGTITKNCRRAVAAALGFRLAHVGINHEDAESALANAAELDRMLGLGLKDGNSSAFCGSAVEFMKKPYHGEKGHIGFYTNSVVRAKAWFERNGIAIREESIKRNGEKLVSFYLKDEVGGFAVHVVSAGEAV